MSSAKRNVRFGSLADITVGSRHVRFTPDSGHSSVQVGGPKSAISRRPLGKSARVPASPEIRFDRVSDEARFVYRLVNESGRDPGLVPLPNGVRGRLRRASTRRAI